MNTITEIPAVELEVRRPAGGPVVVPIGTAHAGRQATGRGVWIILALCSLIFAGTLVARVLLPAVHTVTSTSSQDYQQAP